MPLQYLLRPFAKYLSHARPMSMIESNVDLLIQAERVLHSLSLGILASFLPTVSIQ